MFSILNNHSMSQVNRHIDLSKRYKFPSHISIVHFRDKILAIAVDTARWIVLDNEVQLTFFNILQEQTIADAIEISKAEKSDIIKVITQIEARHLEEIPKNRVSVNGRSMIHLYITNACNLRCPHCYMFAGEKIENELTLNEIKGLISNFGKHKIGLVTLSGGEVTTRPDFEEICMFAHEKGVAFEILTNGTIWTDNMICTLGKLAKRIQISIDGFNEEENRRVRGAGNFSRSLSAVDKLIKVGANVEIAITPVFSENLPQKAQSYVDFAKSLEEKYQGNIKVTFNGDLMDGRDVHLTPEQRDIYLNTVREIENIRHGVNATDMSFVSAMRSDTIKDNCAYGNLSIAANGDVYLCAFLSVLEPVGNIRNMPFEELMKISQQAKQKSNVDNITPCCDCELKYICGGECRIHHFPEMRSSAHKLTAQCARKCSIEQKNKFYDMMLRLNEYIFL